MHDREHLHDAEQLLCSMRAGVPLLITTLLRSVLDAVVIGFFAFLLATLVSALVSADLPGVPTFAALAVLAYALLAARKIQLWRRASFRVTTERLLLRFPATLFGQHERTIKWNQYQESFVGRAGLLSLLFKTRPLGIRHGSPDGEQMVTFPSLPFASDLKHYLDKVDAAVRKGQEKSLQPFIAKPKGKRDV